MIYQIDNRIPQLHDSAWVADNAVVIGSVVMAAGSSIWFNCVVRGDNDLISIGENSNIQDGSLLHTDTGFKLIVGRDCTIGHQVMLHGCEIGDGCLIGIQSVVLNGAKIGQNSIVGAGSVVPEGKVYPDNVLILGSPAVVKRELKPAEYERIRYGAKHYVQNAARYRSSLKALPPR
ncbi:MAG: gamma carbonic anhydrase family protein [Gammaproteobacteria bacterium]|jgi:carbonic anhydrase/acetyltransferase-like protein (isoleucine patch superfamily)|uniref:gamma carbonic anhydrase family protein n=1 Tax=Nevskia sp. TaxID=1929292 RepID=UPI003F72A78A|nr:gamma carbonic anhydrase family protein [Gammaproteobacteria bacterium]